MSLQVVPCTIRDACAFVAQHHRHHRPPQGALFAVAVADETEVRGVAIVGRPVARRLDDGWTVEVTRVATDGKAITYTLVEEKGASVRAAGWTCIGEAGGGSWSCKSRPRVDRHPLQVKLRWEVSA